MTEDELLRLAADRARQLRLHVHHCTMLRSKSGFPDLVIIGPRGVLWRELKSDVGNPSSAQLALAWKLKAAGQDWAIWRPADWHNDTIQTEMTGIA